MTEDPKVTDGEVHWTIQELLTSKELQAEGRAMNHCVSSYANNCLKGSASIWSMQVSDGKTSPHRVMTVAVNNKSRVISQARGKYNALPSGKTRTGDGGRLRRRTPIISDNPSGFYLSGGNRRGSGCRVAFRTVHCQSNHGSYGRPAKARKITEAMRRAAKVPELTLDQQDRGARRTLGIADLG